MVPNRKACGNCGGKQVRGACPADGKQCSKCSKYGHFAHVCRSQQLQQQPRFRKPTTSPPKQVHKVDLYGSEELDDYSNHGIDHLTVDTVNSSSDEHATLTINSKALRLKLDSGAGANVITRKDFDSVVPKRQRQLELRSSTTKLTAFGGHDIPVIGKCTLKCQVDNKTEVLEFQVVENRKSLLGCTDCKKLQLITFTVNDIQQDAEDSVMGMTTEEIHEKYADCFEGLGRISEPYHIKIDKDAEPVIHPPRKIPTALIDRVKDKLDDVESKGVIGKVKELTAWVNSMVINKKKSGKLRICIDPRDLNKAVRREHYQLPTQEEITGRLAGAKYFSHLDATSGFWQMSLDEESSFLTTFHTPFGPYRFTVVPFGFNFAQEVFRRTLILVNNSPTSKDAKLTLMTF